jgi:hypothetical protein
MVLANVSSTDTTAEEPEEDYVALTLSRKGGQIKDTKEEAILTGAVDEAFLNESWGQSGALRTKGKAIKVDKRDFVDVNEKIAKRNNADAFRARFERNKAKTRAPQTMNAEPSSDGGEEDDLDAFLGELTLDSRESMAVF